MSCCTWLRVPGCFVSWVPSCWRGWSPVFRSRINHDASLTLGAFVFLIVLWILEMLPPGLSAILLGVVLVNIL
jgi:hypothetical protein